MEITQVRFPLMVVIVCYIYLNISVFCISYLPPNEAIGRTDRFMAGASSDLSEEMIKLAFFECFQTEPLPLFFAFFFFFFFFFQSEVQNRGAYYTRARIIHG